MGLIAAESWNEFQQFSSQFQGLLIPGKAGIWLKKIQEYFLFMRGKLNHYFAFYCGGFLVM